MTDSTTTSHSSRLRSIRFFLLHHSGCFRGDFHVEVGGDGSVRWLKSEAVRGQHPDSIGVLVSGNHDEKPPSHGQIDALRKLLLDLKLKYPDAQLGAHRQVRGDRKTTCPGRKFPMGELAKWFREDLPGQRNRVIEEIVESQYHP